MSVEAVFFAGLLFGSAGTLVWPSAWIFLILFFGSAVWITRMLARNDPALLAERLKPLVQKDQPVWDRVFISTFVLFFILWLVLIALDAARFRWSSVPRWLQTVGAFGLVLSMWMQYSVFRENTFLAPVVKIQAERGHRVISTGPYAVVRHPMYSAALILLVAVPLLLGSWWGLAATLVLAGLLVVRTIFEEKELDSRLEGYSAYRKRVRSRLVPGLW
jgi:protein-S-isoprenylcysteine O-methyltransferase Ste14